MREKNVKEIVRYYYEIPEMVRLLKTEQREQESLYDTLKGTGGDGMPGGGGPGPDLRCTHCRLSPGGSRGGERGTHYTGGAGAVYILRNEYCGGFRGETACVSRHRRFLLRFQGESGRIRG